MLIRYVIALIMKVAIIGCSYFGKELNELGIATPNPYINSAVYRKIILPQIRNRPHKMTQRSKR